MTISKLTKYAILNTNWVLRGWADKPFVVVNLENETFIRLTHAQFRVISACDGVTNLASLLFRPNDIALVKEFISKGVVRVSNGRDELHPRQNYKKSSSRQINSVLWSITGRCNLKCEHCYLGNTYNNIELSIETIREILEQLIDSNVSTISITGGEPFIRKDIIEILSEINESGINITSIMTNAVSITNNQLEQISRMGLSPTFHVSFDLVGHHDRVRRLNNCESKTILGIEKIKKHGYGLVVSSVINSFDNKSIFNTYNLLKRIGVDYWRLSPPQKIGRWEKDTFFLSNELGHKDALYNLVKKWNLDNQPFKLKVGSFYSGESFNKIKDKTYDPDMSACPSLTYSPYILPDGTLLPCTAFIDSHLNNMSNNIIEHSLADIWSKQPFEQISSLKKRDFVKSNAECIDCKYLNKCDFGCLANGFIDNNMTLGKDSIHCEAWLSGLAEKLYNV